MAEHLRVLFVDDDPRILQGLKRMLRPQRDSWEMTFADSPEQALEIVARRSIDVIVSDMRMPGMTGTELLEQVRRRQPSTARLVLSGQADHDAVLSGLGPIHQFLQKPCDGRTIQTAVSRTSGLVSLLSAPALREVAASVEVLPSWPEVLLELTRTLDREDASAEQIAEIIERDPGMTAKIIQLVNSAFFASPRPITAVRDAVVRLGANTIRGLLITAHAFDCIEDFAGCIVSRQTLWNTSLSLSRQAAAVAGRLGLSCPSAGAARLAAMLALTGRLVLIGAYPEVYAEWGSRPGASLPDVEHERFGATYAEVGAYLLGLWGFEPEIVDAVAFHRHPSDSPGDGARALDALHIAAVAIAQRDADGPCSPLDPDGAYFERRGLRAQAEACGVTGVDPQQECAA